MKHLFCIFNANDPTPTAYAIRSSTYDKVTVFVIGQERYGERQERALYRLKKWLSGSGKSSEDWPQGLWKDAWDWEKPEADVHIVEIENISEDVFEADPDASVIVDLKGGTKKMSIEMMEYANQRFTNPQFIMSNIGSCILFSHGLVVPTTHLSLNEMVWLSSGFVIDVDYAPDEKFASKAVQKLKYRTETKTTAMGNSGHQRIVFTEQYLRKMGKRFFGNKRKERAIHYKYLEEFTASALKNKEDIVEVYGGVRFIYPKRVESCLRRAKWALIQTLKPMKYVKDNLATFEQFFETKECQDAGIINLVRKFIHTMEIDSLALTSDGLMIGVECKYGDYSEIDVDRLHAICSRLSPRFHPLFINTRLIEERSSGVRQIPFPRLLEPLQSILSSSLDTRPLIPNSEPPTDVEVAESKPKAEEIANPVQELALSDSVDVIRDLLIIVKESPISWPEFYKLLQQQGVKTKGLLKFLEAEFSERLGFSIKGSKAELGVQWILWDES
jgi:hypothetical protein